MKIIIVSAFCLLLLSCYQENNYSNNNAHLEQKIDSLQEQILQLKKELSQPPLKKDSLLQTSIKQNNSNTKKTDSVAKKTVPKKKQPSLLQEKKDIDTAYHHYKNGKLSVKIFPWNNGKRRIIVYNPQGQITYEFEDIRLSYSYHTEFKFRKDGSIENSITHMNPGASMHWYETIITFDNSNIPVTKEEKEFPLTRLEKIQLPYFWNKEKKQWIQQEIVK